MRDNYVESVKLALFDLFENKPANRAVMSDELTVRLPKDLTQEEFQAALEQLDKDLFVESEKVHRHPYLFRFLRGASYQKWRAQMEATQVNTTWNITDTQFTGPTHLGNGGTINIQINESDSKELINLIEVMVADPEAKSKASSIIEALKSGAIESAKEAIRQLFKLFVLS